MAFKNLGVVVNLAPGASVVWGYSADGFADLGVQVAHGEDGCGVAHRYPAFTSKESRSASPR